MYEHCEALRVYSLPGTPVFQEALQSNRPNKLALKALHLDKAQDFPVQSRRPHILCSANYAEGQKILLDASRTMGVLNLQ